LVNGSLASLAPTFRRDSRCTKDSVKERDKSLNGGIMGGGMKPQAMGAMNEVSVTGPDERMAEGLGDGGTGGAAGDGALSLRRRQEEEIEGEGNREVLGDLEGKEGGGESVERGNGEASEPRERALGDAAVKEAGSPRGRGDRGVQKGKESARSHHCRGCSLSVWVASGIEAVQVINEGRGIMRIVEIIVTGCPKGHGSGAKPAIIKV